MKKEAKNKKGLDLEAKVHFFKQQLERKGYFRSIIEIKSKLTSLLSKKYICNKIFMNICSKAAAFNHITMDYIYMNMKVK